MDPFNCKKVTYIDKEGQKCVATSSLKKHCLTCKKAEESKCSGKKEYYAMTEALQSLNKVIGQLF